MTSQANAGQLWKEEGAGKMSSSLREAFASRPKKEFSVFICIFENKAVPLYPKYLSGPDVAVRSPPYPTLGLYKISSNCLPIPRSPKFKLPPELLLNVQGLHVIKFTSHNHLKFCHLLWVETAAFISPGSVFKVQILGQVRWLSG